jgi:2'-5' RNA ligase
MDELIKKSVTRDDFIPVSQGGGVIHMTIPLWGAGMTGKNILLPPIPPAYWTPGRDAVLRSTVHNEALWAGAIGIAITKKASQAFEVDSTIPLRARRMQDILLQADGRRVGWVGFLSKHLRDYLTTDNGCFIEIVRATSSAGSRIVGLRHLDSLRCVRTGDPDIPVIYRDRKGSYHELKDYQVIGLSDMPDPGDTFYGVGMCAASRAYAAIYKLAAIEWYLREKVSGQHPLAIYIVNGILEKQLQGAVTVAKEDELAKGVAAYMGAVILGVPSETQANVAVIPLAELPDRFERKEEFDIAVLTYANAIGLDPQDLQPLTGQSLGSGAQSQVLDDKTKGKGLAMWSQDFTHALNEYVLDEMTTFQFVENDYRDNIRIAEVSKKRAEVSEIRVKAGITTPEQEKQVLVDQNELPKEFLTSDMTPGETLDDTEKPETIDADNQAEEPVDEKPKTWGEKEHDGTMIGFFLSDFQNKQIGENEYHLTLAYMENTDTEKIVKVVSDFAKTELPIIGKINGSATFKNENETANVLLVDAPELSEFRERLVKLLSENDISYSKNHGFIPHITVSYGNIFEPLEVEKIDMLFNTITIAMGDEHIDIPLTGKVDELIDGNLSEAENMYTKYALKKELLWNLKQ